MASSEAFNFLAMTSTFNGENGVEPHEVADLLPYTKDASQDLHVYIKAADFNDLFTFNEEYDSWAWNKPVNYNLGTNVDSVHATTVAVVNSIQAAVNTERLALVNATSTATGNLAEILLVDEITLTDVDAGQLKTMLGGTAVQHEDTLPSHIEYGASSIEVTGCDDVLLTKQLRKEMHAEGATSERTEEDPFVPTDIIYLASCFEC